MARADSGRECEPDCEYWSDAALSINRSCDVHVSWFSLISHAFFGSAEAEKMMLTVP